VLSAEDLLSADIAARDALELQREQAERQFEVSLIPITDVQEARAGYDQAVASVIGSERTLASAQEGLREIIDDYIPDLRAPVAELPLVSPNPDDVDAWVEISQGQNLSLVAARIAAEIAGDDIEISRAARFPTLSLSASNGDRSSTTSTTINLPSGGTGPGSGLPRESGGDSTTLSLNLNVPIFNGGANGSRIRQAVQQRRAAIETVERIARQTERQTRDAYLGVNSEISRVEALAQALQSARLALQATEAAEEVGQRTRVDVINQLNSVRRAETQYAAARYEYLLNILRLKQAAGSLTEADLIEIDALLE
jgi:outer membrane protein